MGRERGGTMSPLGRKGTYGCVTRTRYKREKGGSAAIGAEDPAREGGRLKKAAGRTEREEGRRGRMEGEGGWREETRIVSAAK